MHLLHLEKKPGKHENVSEELKKEEDEVKRKLLSKKIAAYHTANRRALKEGNNCAGGDCGCKTRFLDLFKTCACSKF